MLGNALGKMDEAAAHVANSAVRLLVWPVVYALCAGAAVYGVVHDDRLRLLRHNKLTKEERVEGLYYFAGALLIFGLLYAASIGYDRWRTKQWTVAKTTGYLNRLLAFSIGTPFVGALMTPTIESKGAKLTLTFIAFAAMTCVPTLLVLTPNAGKRLVPERYEKYVAVGVRYLVPALLVGGFTFYGWFFTKLSVTNHHALTTRTIDLGYYDNIFYQSAHGRFLDCSFLRGGNHISAHFDPILVLLSPLYLLAPRAETLLTLQSLWLAMGIFPTYLLGKHALSSRAAGLVAAATYMLHPAVHGPNLYEFHSLTLVAPPLLWALFFLESKRFKSYWATLFFLLLVREDVSLLVSFVAIYALLKNDKQHARAGWITLLVCVAYFFGVKRFIMASPDVLNDGTGAYGFSYYFKDMIPNGGGMRDLLTSLLTNPTFVFQYILAEPKLEYLMKLFIPVLAFPFIAKPGRFMLLYGLAFTLLAERKPVYQTGFQYSLLILPVIIALAPQGVARLRDGRASELLGIPKHKLVVGALGAMLISSALTSWKFGAILENTEFRGGFARVTRKLSPAQEERYRAVSQMVAIIEPGAGVTVTNKTGPHASNRRHAYLYRQKKVHESHYVFIDEADLRKDVKAWHNRRVQRGELEELAAHGTIKLFRFHPENEKAKVPNPKGQRAAPKAAPPSRPRPSPKRTPEDPATDSDLVDDRDAMPSEG